MGEPKFPNNWYHSTWFKRVFDFAQKMKVVKIVFWPYHCVEKEETKPLLKTASKSDIGNVLTRRHTRLLHPDELTRPEYQTTRPTCQTRIMMTSLWRNHDASIHSQHACKRPVSRHVSVQSACHVIIQSATRQRPVISHVISVGPTCHVTSYEPSWAEPNWSRAELEPSRAASRGIRFCAAESTCNRIWDWIWTVHQARIVLIKS